MVSFWGKSLLVRVTLLAGLSAALLGVVWTISQGPGQAKNTLNAGIAQASTGGADRVAGTDASNGTQDSRPAASLSVSEAEAIAIAEKAANGRAAKVDKQGKDSTIHVQRADGKTSRVRVNATGSVIETTLVPSASETVRDNPKTPEARSKDIRGTVRAMDMEKRTVTLIVREKGKEREAAYRLAPNARMSGPNDKPVSSVERGARVRVLLGDDDAVVELRVEKKKPRNDD